MNNVINILRLIIPAFLLSVSGYTQTELITPLSFNQALKQFNSNNYRESTFDTLDLDINAFWDDFSQDFPTPKPEFWMDNFVYINSSLPYKPMSYNVATFDGLNEIGNPYNPGVTNSKGSIADRLTSVPINLLKYTDADSIYLSFFYQPQGIGDAPESFDSLVLEFKPVKYWNGNTWDSTAWVRMWSMEGSSLHPFKQVIIKVPMYLIDTSQTVDTIAYFYHSAFQFRFMNYGNLAGNMDHWHLDYVYLNKGRHMNDLYYKDMSITKLPLSLLKDYRSMPWAHFDRESSLLRSTLKIYARNMSDQPLNLIGRCGVIDTIDHEYLLFSGDNKTVYKNDTALTLAFNVRDSLQTGKIKNADTVILRVELSSRIIDDYKSNDLSVLYQEFNNFYAYDDGIPEMGYGIYPGNFSQVAYKFKAGNIPNEDSLRGIYMFFNRSDENVSNMAFKILIWNKGDYKTEPVVIETHIPDIDPVNGNGFYYFPFDTILSIKSDFYIGWEQNAEYYLNIGLDMNYYELLEDTFPVTANPNIFYKTYSDWKSSSAKGALMIRPLFSSKSLEPSSIQMADKVENQISVYPNPAYDYLFINGIDEGNMDLFDCQGKLIKSCTCFNNDRIDISELNPGLYIVRITEHITNKMEFKKVIVK